MSQKSFVEQLNLTPQERRVVFVIAGIVFVVLNYLLVWPHYGDWGKAVRQLDDMRATIQKWNKGITADVDPSNGYKVQLQKLQKQQGAGIGTAQLQLQRTVSDQAFKTGVNVSEIRPVNSIHPDTNEFYAEQSVRITFECQEAQLINFLYNVGNDPAMIRVRELNLRPADANRYRLKGDATLTANYEKKPAAKPAAPATPAPGAKPGQSPQAPSTPKTAPGPQPPGKKT